MYVRLFLASNFVNVIFPGTVSLESSFSFALDVVEYRVAIPKAAVKCRRLADEGHASTLLTKMHHVMLYKLQSVHACTKFETLCFVAICSPESLCKQRLAKVASHGHVAMHFVKSSSLYLI